MIGENGVVEQLAIGRRLVGTNRPVYVIAEMSANHLQDYDRAVRILEAAKEAGADAVKLQTYTPDTMTIDCDDACFRVGQGTIWEGKSLYQLYGEARTPWEWHPRLKAVANDLGLHLFSTPFDATAVDYLEEMGVPAYKIASFEVVDLPLVRRVAETGKPVIMSVGMASREEIDEALLTIRATGNDQVALLKCTSAYPALPEEMNLRAIPRLREVFGVPVGLSDHTLGIAVAVTAVALNACIIEKHLTLSRAAGGPDGAFSLEPHEFKALVDAVRVAEGALGDVAFTTTEREGASRVFRRSLFVVKDVRAGERFTADNVRSIRPGAGLHTRYLPEVLHRRAAVDLRRGTPLRREHLDAVSEPGHP